MRFTIVIGSLHGGGAERVACNLANHLVQWNHDVEMLICQELAHTYPLDSRVSVEPLVTIDNRGNALNRFFVRIAGMRRYIKQKQVDVYLIMLPMTTIMFLSMCKGIKSKVFTSERSTPTTYSKWKQWCLRKLMRRADGCICQTEEIRNWYATAPGCSNTIIIPNAINPDFIKPMYEGTRKKTIVTAGRLKAQKNQKLLITAFGEIANEYPDYDLAIYGEGPLHDELVQYAESLGLSDRVQFPGYLATVSDAIKDASLFVLSSDYEGMPNALMEALALGLPCIATDCDGGGARFLIKDGVNGRLIAKQDKDALVAAMRSILSNPDLAASYGKEAHKICDELAPEKIYKMWETYMVNTPKRTSH